MAAARIGHLRAVAQRLEQAAVEHRAHVHRHGQRRFLRRAGEPLEALVARGALLALATLRLGVVHAPGRAVVDAAQRVDLLLRRRDAVRGQTRLRGAHERDEALERRCLGERSRARGRRRGRGSGAGAGAGTRGRTGTGGDGGEYGGAGAGYPTGSSPLRCRRRRPSRATARLPAARWSLMTSACEPQPGAGSLPQTRAAGAPAVTASASSVRSGAGMASAEHNPGPERGPATLKAARSRRARCAAKATGAIAATDAAPTRPRADHVDRRGLRTERCRRWH